MVKKAHFGFVLPELTRKAKKDVLLRRNFRVLVNSLPALTPLESYVGRHRCFPQDLL